MKLEKVVDDIITRLKERYPKRDIFLSNN